MWRSAGFVFGAGLLAALLGGPARAAGSGELTLIHMGDLHGHLLPRASVHGDAQGRSLGGVARLYTRIQEIRAREPNTLLVNSGDTVQGSAEALFTRGEAMVEVLNHFGIDAFNPGNWDYVYGSRRFVELFAGNKPLANWNAIAANLYYVTTDADAQSPFAALGGRRVLPPYLIRQFQGFRVGILGLTSDRGPTLVGRQVTRGLLLSRGEAELGEFIAVLRKQEKVDLLVLASELGLANNVRLARRYPGIDVILSSDMHEQTRQPVLTESGTLVVEEGQDGTLLGELNLSIREGRVEKWRWRSHLMDESVVEDPAIAQAVARARAPFVAGPDFRVQTNPINGARLLRPIDTVVGYTRVPLYRGADSGQDIPGVVEATSHDFLADAFRSVARSDLAAIRGFRYGTEVAPGPIRLEDLYHYLPIGAQIAVAQTQGRWFKRHLETMAEGCLDPNPALWTGGWLFAYSGLTLDLDPYRATGLRFSNIRVGSKPLAADAVYSHAGYWYADEPDQIAGCDCPKLPGTSVMVLRAEDGSTLDATDVVLRYLDSLPERTVAPGMPRIHLLQPLPAPLFGFPEIQPLQGASHR